MQKATITYVQRPKGRVVAQLGSYEGPEASGRREALAGLLGKLQETLQRLLSGPVVFRVPGTGNKQALVLAAVDGGVLAAYFTAGELPACPREVSTLYSDWPTALWQVRRNLARLAWAAGEPWEPWISPGDKGGREGMHAWILWQARYKAAREAGADEQRAREIADKATGGAL